MDKLMHLNMPKVNKMLRRLTICGPSFVQECEIQCKFISNTQISPEICDMLHCSFFNPWKGNFSKKVYI